MVSALSSIVGLLCTSCDVRNFAEKSPDFVFRSGFVRTAVKFNAPLPRIVASHSPSLLVVVRVRRLLVPSFAFSGPSPGSRGDWAAVQLNVFLCAWAMREECCFLLHAKMKCGAHLVLCRSEDLKNFRISTQNFAKLNSTKSSILFIKTGGAGLCARRRRMKSLRFETIK